MPTARTRANRKYNEKAYDRIGLTIVKGGGAKIRDAAATAGQSVNAYVVEAIREKMARQGLEL